MSETPEEYIAQCMSQMRLNIGLGCVAGVAAPLVSLERPLEGSTAWRGGRITPILRPGACACDLALEGVGCWYCNFIMQCNSHINIS